MDAQKAHFTKVTGPHTSTLWDYIKAKVGLKRGKLLGNALASGPFENSSAGAGRPLGNTLAAGKAPAGLERSAADRWEGRGVGSVATTPRNLAPLVPCRASPWATGSRKERFQQPDF